MDSSQQQSTGAGELLKSQVYLLQLTAEKVNSDQSNRHLKVLKRILLWMFEQNRVNADNRGRIIVEVYLSQDTVDAHHSPEHGQSGIMGDDARFMQSLFTQAYNLVEPEHSEKYPLQILEILSP
mmetsp:Transcript_3772/g.6439  ORF Transcript_3772/g.6439 Transcript_3772/m.6439 type:complete len:124 (+) Transcript_3772:44-415(+)